MKITCPDCHQNYEVDETYIGRSVSCQACGKTFDVLKPVETEATRCCPFCGEKILSVAKKCKHCGEFINENGPPRPKIDRVIYILLALLFGSIGGHNVYANEYYSCAGKVILFILTFVMLGIAPPLGAITAFSLFFWVLFDIVCDPNIRNKSKSSFSRQSPSSEHEECKKSL